MKRPYKWLVFLFLFVILSSFGMAQDTLMKREAQYYKITDVPIPDSIKLEVGGMVFNDKGQLAVSTRQGDIWLIDHPSSTHPKYFLFASGLHEPLGLAFKNGAYYTAQRGELTKITDTDQEGRADLFQTVYAWPLSGNYHEYSYGPLLLPDGNMIVTLNLGWTHGHMESLAKWRGWMLKISPQGKMEPYATGMRSPAGFGLNANGALFYAENQGDWIGSGWITYVEKGDFTGHPMGLRWADQPDVPVRGLDMAMFPDSIGTMYAFAKKHPQLKLPAVWFPQGIMGISTSGILNIASAGFGPFKDQLLVGDEGQSKVMRVYLEKVDGKYQGACFPFREGFSSGVLRLAWGKGSTLYVGMTNRGWPSTGRAQFGLQRLTWTGKTPFEMKEIHAEPYGFEIDFTLPVNKKTAEDLNNYKVTGFAYLYHSSYGSPIVNKQNCPIEKVEVSPDGRKVKLYMMGLRKGYIHEIKLQGLRSAKGIHLLHDFAYYTLNNLPEGKENAIALSQTAPNHMKGGGACASDPSKTITAPPGDWQKGPDQIITLNTAAGLTFDKKEIEVKAGSRIQLNFNNKDDMLHNLVIVNPGKLDEIGKAALNMGIDGPDQGYIPNGTDVLHATCLLQPESSQTVYFTAPEKPGNYPYLCTYPGHYLSMNGVLKVVKK